MHQPRSSCATKDASHDASLRIGSRARSRWLYTLLLLAAGWWLCGSDEPRAAGEPTDELTARIRASAKVPKGFCVHLGVSDGALTRALAGKDAFLVHGLATEASTMHRVRAQLQAAGVYGRVSVERGSLERLPYADDLANLMVVDDLAAALKVRLSFPELLRVLAPNGVAWVGCRQGLTAEALKQVLADAKVTDFSIVESGGVWARVTKQRPAGYGDWTHHHCDVRNRRVSQDTVVEPPQRLNWIAGKPWPSEDYGPFGMRAAGERVFYAYDESPHRARTRWPYLTTRDAYSGVLLWKRPVPGYLPLATIATEDRLYTAFGGSEGVLVALDARTGQEVQSYKEGGKVNWAVLHEGRLLVSSGAGRLRCLDARSGKLLWSQAKWSVGRFPDIAADGQRLYVKEFGKNLLGCLALEDGKEIWSVDYSKHLANPKLGSGFCAYCSRNEVVVLGEGSGYLDMSGKGVHAFSTKNGQHLWSHQYERLGVPSRRKAKSYMDGMFVDGLFWVHVGDVVGGGPVQREGEPRVFYWLGLDPRTGKEVKRYDYPKEVKVGASCYVDQATVRYFMGGYTDFVDTATGKYHPRATGLHGGCGFGVMPANGRLYANVLYQPRIYLQGDVAMVGGTPPEPVEPLLEKGESAPPEKISKVEAGDWPCYRHDAARSGRSTARVAVDLKSAWEAAVGGRLSPPTAAGGLVYVASVDAHQVVALDADTGRERWRFTAGGRVPLPPTIHQGICLFGANDGWVYALTADEGKLVWRLRAARSDRRIVAHEQVESSWPVSQGVIAVDGLAYFSAGRHGDVDGGIDLHAVKGHNGEIVWRKPAVKGIATTAMLLAGDRSVALADNKCRFALKDGSEKGTRPTFPDSAYFADTLLPDYIVGKKPGQDGGFPEIAGHTVALIRASGHIIAAGQPRPADSKPELRWVKRPQVILDLPEEDPGRFPEPLGNEVWLFPTEGGPAVTRLPLPAAPTFDGLAVVEGKLFVSCKDGKLRCFSNK